ncbi:MAG: twin-arginine translocation pathway signal protein, partial [Planctomycetota bacterium]
HNNSHRIGKPGFSWKTEVWFPHEDLCDHVQKQDPDLLFFSGDQVYEGNSPTFADGANIKLDYLYKWYLWCWAYRDLAKDIPTISIPDDHDVYQGNLWGEGGRPIDKDDKGGYVHPAEFVKMVELTQTTNLPDPYDPTPIEQGIGVYYTSMNWGRLSIAIIEDRKFKSGCNGRVPPGGASRADHVVNPDYDVMSADVPGLQLLGERQEKFLREWAEDWAGADMKLVFSQTVFAGLATHHGPGLQYLIADFDSNGWPQSGRKRAVDLLRKAFAFHLAGDQHLATLVHHGIDDWEDAGWSFAVPSIANFYPRMWKPPVPGENRIPGYPEWTGRHFDGMKNRVTMYAATNPDWSTGREPAELHDKMPGYGILRCNRYARTITVECWPRYADPANPADTQYPGWPRTIIQNDNYGRKAVAWLPMLRVHGIANPVVKVFDAEGELVYAIRCRGPYMRPKVFAEGRYKVVVGEPDTNTWKTLELDAIPEAEGVVDVDF